MIFSLLKQNIFGMFRTKYGIQWNKKQYSFCLVQAIHCCTNTDVDTVYIHIKDMKLNANKNDLDTLKEKLWKSRYLDISSNHSEMIIIPVKTIRSLPKWNIEIYIKSKRIFSREWTE